MPGKEISTLTYSLPKKHGGYIIVGGPAYGKTTLAKTITHHYKPKLLHVFTDSPYEWKEFDTHCDVDWPTDRTNNSRNYIHVSTQNFKDNFTDAFRQWKNMYTTLRRNNMSTDVGCVFVFDTVKWNESLEKNEEFIEAITKGRHLNVTIIVVDACNINRLLRPVVRQNLLALFTTNHSCYKYYFDNIPQKTFFNVCDVIRSERGFVVKDFQDGKIKLFSN